MASIIGLVVQVSNPFGGVSFEIRPFDPKKVSWTKSLYAWDDGIVTWTLERQDGNGGD